MPPAPPIPPRVNPGDYHFHTYDYAASAAFTLSPGQPTVGGMQFYSLVQDLGALLQNGQQKNVPNIALTNLGAPVTGGRNTMALSFGAMGAPAAVITGGIHAREWAAPEMVYLLAEYLIHNYVAGPQFQSNYQRKIHNLIHSRRIHIIPMLNPAGNWYTVFSSRAGARIWRKNRRALPRTPTQWVAALVPGGPGTQPTPPFQNVQKTNRDNPAYYDVPDYNPAGHVPPQPPNYRTRPLTDRKFGVDLNRNCTTTAWGYDCSTSYRQYDPAREAYFGPAPGSEVETSNIQTFLANAAGLANAIDYHSYGQLILYPGEVFNAGAVGSDYTSLGQTLQQLVRSQAAVDYQLGSPQQVIGYEATGSIIDHMAQQYHMRAFTIELDPPLGQGITGFMLPENQIKTVFEKNIRGALAVIGAPSPTTNWFGSLIDRAAIALVEREYLGWNVYNRGNQLPL